MVTNTKYVEEHAKALIDCSDVSGRDLVCHYFICPSANDPSTTKKKDVRFEHPANRAAMTLLVKK